MMTLLILIWLGVITCLAYRQTSLRVWSLMIAILLAVSTYMGSSHTTLFITLWIIFGVIAVLLNVTSLRRQFISKHLMSFFQKMMPRISTTEKEALAAGTITWEGELFKGKPNWYQLLHLETPVLTEEEQAFLAGPVEALCKMLHDWQITHEDHDLSPEAWRFIKEQGFFGLIIPKEYGGKAFSATAHAAILVKVYSVSITAAITIGVPNSLGPAELLLHYGTPEQKNYYLPRLARGEEIPAFALTSPEAGSDAGAMPDKGIICYGEYAGEKTLGILLNWDKRYITLAPVATVLGLAFKLYDPDHLLGDKTNLGITCALIPTNIQGITIGRRHFPLNVVFQNGPTQGKDVFIPLSMIIGGPAMAGQGWRMLMECLAAGRAITLPSTAVSGMRLAALATGAYARIRRQFKLPIGKFEGIEEALARIAGYTYMMNAATSFTISAIDRGEKPALASAMMKYHATTRGRLVINDAMDVHGGKAVCLGPKNYLGRIYESIPVSITVEGANILTRSMIIFGQGVLRCHPYLFLEIEAAQTHNLKKFDHFIFAHAGFIIANKARSFFLGLTSGCFVDAPAGRARRYFQILTRFTANFAFLTDLMLIALKGDLKRREKISGRLGDILSLLYIGSALLKSYQETEQQSREEFNLLRWCMEDIFYNIQQSFDALIKNFPYRFYRLFLRLTIFPLGKPYSPPSDALGGQVAKILLSPSPLRSHLTRGLFITPEENNPIGILEDFLPRFIDAELIEKRLEKAKKAGQISGEELIPLITAGLASEIISQIEADKLLKAEEVRKKIIAVDSFEKL